MLAPIIVALIELAKFAGLPVKYAPLANGVLTVAYVEGWQKRIPF